MSIHLKTLLYKAVLLSMVLGLLGVTIALAASGDLDTTFSSDGRVITNVVPSNSGRDDVLEGIAIQSNGKIIAAGYSYISGTTTMDFALTRYNLNGSLDTTFSGDGRLITNFGGEDKAYDVAVQSNGKIVVAGETCVSEICDVALARYNADGTLDTTFSGDGKQKTDLGGVDNGLRGGLAIQANGKIVVTGYMYNGADYDFAVYRYNSNGTLDTTFSANWDGVAIGGFGAGRQDYATDLVTQSDGKIVMTGYSGDGSSANNNFIIVRLNANGTADTTFSGDGRVMTDFGTDEVAWGVDVQGDGKIVVAGKKQTTDTLYYFAVARYNVNGSLDITFDGDGKKVFSVNPGVWSYARDVKVLSNGKILVMGRTESNNSGRNFALVRLTPTGDFDTTFSGDGKVTVDFGVHEFGAAIAVQPSNGSYVLGGDAITGNQRDFASARVFP